SNEQRIDTQLRGISAKKVTGKVLTSAKINDYNSFEQPSNITVKDFKGATLSGGSALSVVLPAKAVVMLEIE
ncbi:MAG: alpha-N-arabinofuranosidase, partial [Proteiniphilum sp.]|nr:alpha-N-arabinofuranosidase [Proteiniphilum sp.]